MHNPTIKDVKEFWEKNPLFNGESHHTPGTIEFFEEHRSVIINDGFAGEIDSRVLPDEKNKKTYWT